MKADRLSRREGAPDRLHIAKVLACHEAGPEVCRLIVEAPRLARTAEPGQFVHVKVGSLEDPCSMLLRRPLSIHRVEGDTITLLIRKTGRGTAWLASRRPGDDIDLLGPLGTGFALPVGDSAGVESISPAPSPVGAPTAPPAPTAVVVAGGIGCGPLLFLLDRLRARGVRTVYLAGGRHSKELLALEDFTSAADEVRWATDDGSFGKKGFVTQLLVEYLQALSLGPSRVEVAGDEPAAPPAEIFACGPEPMLKAVSDIASKYGVPAQLSVEALMACGIGVCLSCVHKAKVDDREEYVRVCVEGPVFRADQIVWEDSVG